jgi:hypothetical protein
MSSQAESTPLEPSDPAYWGEIRNSSPYPYYDLNIPYHGTPANALRMAVYLDFLESHPPSGPSRIYNVGESLEIQKLEENSIVSFSREYRSAAGAEDATESYAMLEALKVTEPGLIATQTRYPIENFYDLEEGIHWVIRDEVQSGFGIAVRADHEARIIIVGIKRRRTLRGLSEDEVIKIRKRPLGEPKPQRQEEIAYDYVHLKLPLHSPAPIGISTEAPDPTTGEVNPLSRRIERLNIVQVFAPQPNQF